MNDVHQGYTGSARMEEMRCMHDIPGMPCLEPAETADAVEVQEAMAEKQIMKQRRDKLRSLLEQRMGPEDASQFESHLETLIWAGLRTARMIRTSNWQVLEKIGLPAGQILTLGEDFDVPGDP